MTGSGISSSVTKHDLLVLFVMGPHSDHLYCSDFLQDLINKTVLDIDSAGISSRKVADKFLEGRWRLVWILSKNIKEFSSPLFQACGSNLSGILLRLLRINDSPLLYHPGFSLHFWTGVFMPLRIDSLMPGMERR